MTKRLDQKLDEIQADPIGSKAFILADAKDADMAFGIRSPGLRRDGAWRKLPEYHDRIRDVVAQGLVDIVLMSASTIERLAIREGLFEQSPVTAAGRSNDSTDIWITRDASYAEHPSLPFRSATIDHLLHGQIAPTEQAERRGVDLGLYSITLTGELVADHDTLTAYAKFREEAETKGFRHFLEVFNPNAGPAAELADPSAFVNDSIVRALAGVPRSGRPLFLKIAYNGPAALEELVTYDPELVVGILGGSAGTARDAFQLLADARRHGARVALFGRKINQAEDQLLFIQHLRWIADGEIDSTEAVRSYHDALAQKGLTPWRSLEDDLVVTKPESSYESR